MNNFRKTFQNNLQKTLKKSATIEGVGLHSGKLVRMTIHPAYANHGIVFVRTDLEGSPKIPAHYSYVVNTQMATTLGKGKATVGTVEHVMAAFQGLGIDNALVELNGSEVPILDGSSIRFCESILDIGLVKQAQTRPYVILKRRVDLRVDEKWAVAEPADRLSVHSSIDWDHPAIGYQEFTYIEGRTSFTELAAARTFGFLRDVEALRRMGLARGGSLENAVVLNEGVVLNPEGLRFPDEFVRHKVLDALGDLKLAGISIQAKIRLHRSGHDLHSQLLSAIFSNPDCFEIIDESQKDMPREVPVTPSLVSGLSAARVVGY
jgi:UDP-3-O-[3-hydroxymyristoyl] N-acetylglucosamine deacetylase